MTPAQLALLILLAEELKTLYEHFENPQKARAIAAALSAVQREHEHPAEAR